MRRITMNPYRAILVVVAAFSTLALGIGCTKNHENTKSAPSAKSTPSATSAKKASTGAPKKTPKKPTGDTATLAKKVEIQTSLGKIVLDLYPDKAPKTVANFSRYIKEGFYDGTIFHRVISTFMIQGGGFTQDKQKKQTRAPITNEADNGLKNVRGTIAMARTFSPHSATAQFFINVRDNPNLDHRGKTPRGWGYCVFGKVSQGMDVVDKIKDTPVSNQGGPFANLPTTPVVIQKVKILE